MEESYHCTMYSLGAVFSTVLVALAMTVVASIDPAEQELQTGWTYAMSNSSKIIIGSDVYGIVLWKPGTTVTIDLTSRTAGASANTMAQFRKAIKMWNSCMNGRVKVVETKRGQVGHYTAVYSRRCCGSSSAVACATLPHGYSKGKNDNIICFSTVLNNRVPKLKRNTFLHELGHLMGLRHTHDFRENGSYEPEPDRVAYFSYNKNSIMSYTSYSPNRRFTKDDCQGTKKLYSKIRTENCIYAWTQDNKWKCSKFKTISP